MNIQNRGELKREAGEALAAASYDPQKLILIHSAASVAVALILSLVSHLLQLGIDETGGLGGISTRAMLETAQTFLMCAQGTAVLFWQIGLTYAALQISKGRHAGPASLAEGFRRFGPVLRLRLLTGMLYGARAFLCVYLASAVFALTPWAQPMADAMADGSEEAILAASEVVMLPLTCVLAVVMAVMLIPYFYRLRLADYALMDDPAAGAMMALRRSRLLTYRKRMDLFKLDLSFWWFYALAFLAVLVGYGDLILPMFGIELPWSATVSYYVFLVLCYGCQLWLYWWKGSHVQVTYAMAYRSLLPKEEPPAVQE